MPVLVDGYNVLFALGEAPKTAGPGALQAARAKLLGWLTAGLGSGAKDAVVVFDASNAPAGAPGDYIHSGIEVRFARRRQEADDLIEEQIRQCTAPAQLVVVSSDHRLRQAALRRGARSVKSDEFLDWLEEQKAKGRPTPSTSAEDRRQAGSPDEWLQAFGHLDADPSLGRPTWLRPEDFDS